jgi:hypothetical protein
MLPHLSALTFCVGILSATRKVDAFFGVQQPARDFLERSGLTQTQFSTFLSFSKVSDADDDKKDKPNLVDQTTYLQSIETLQRETARVNGEEFMPPENPPVYALGRLEVALRIDTPPGLDLTETTVPKPAGGTNTGTEDDTFTEIVMPGLVLVSAVTGNAAEAGLKALDTIVGVSCNVGDVPFEKNLNSESLDATAMALQGAVAHAWQHNVTEITLELNRLIEGYYK